MKLFSEIDIRFRDLDSLGHVNNAVYLSYIEQSRIEYFNAVLGNGYDWTKLGVLIARTEINYISPILLHHKLTCNIECITIGNKSMELHFKIFVSDNEGKHEVSNGINILVCYDHSQRKSVPIPNIWKEALKNYEERT